MGLSRRIFTKEFKLAAVRRLEQGVSIGEAARALEVNPNVLHRWRKEFRSGPGNVFPGHGKLPNAAFGPALQADSRPRSEPRASEENRFSAHHSLPRRSHWSRAGAIDTDPDRKISRPRRPHSGD